MIYLYTGALNPNTSQTNPDISLGGNVSSSTIPRNIDNLFSDISWMSVENRAIETKAYVIKNNTGADILNYTIGYTYPPNCIFKLEIAPVTLANDTTMEKLSNSSDTPYYATFVEANVDPTKSIDNSLNLGTIAAGAVLGIWIRRSIIADPSNQVVCPLDIIPSPSEGDCCDILQEEIDLLKTITAVYNTDFKITLTGGRVLEWVIFKTAIYPFDLKIGLTLEGNEILEVSVQDAQPVQILRYATGSEFIYFTGIPNNTTVTIKIS